MAEFKTIKELFDKLPEETQQKYFDLVGNTLDGFLWCDRVWAAWSYGTMSAEDFSDAATDEVVYEHAVNTYGLFLELNGMNLSVD